MQSVAGSRIMWLGILVSALVTGIPAQFGGVATPRERSERSGWATPTSLEYDWISYSDTGCNTFVATTGRCTPVPNQSGRHHCLRNSHGNLLPDLHRSE